MYSRTVGSKYYVCLSITIFKDYIFTGNLKKIENQSSCSIYKRISFCLQNYYTRYELVTVVIILISHHHIDKLPIRQTDYDPFHLPPS